VTHRRLQEQRASIGSERFIGPADADTGRGAELEVLCTADLVAIAQLQIAVLQQVELDPGIYEFPVLRHQRGAGPAGRGREDVFVIRRTQAEAADPSVLETVRPSDVSFSEAAVVLELVNDPAAII